MAALAPAYEIALIETNNELVAELFALRAETQRAHLELDRCLIPRRDPHRAAYELAERVALLNLNVLTADALANEHQIAHARCKHDLQVSERRRVKLEIALRALRRVNWFIDAWTALARKIPTPVRLIRRNQK